MKDPRVQILNQDAYVYLKRTNQIFDVIIIDLPDPKSVDLARLYSLQFYQLIKQHLSREGVVVTQATSPFFARDAFFSILKSMRAAGIPATALHNNIPTMGEWGWVLGINSPKVNSDELKDHLAQLRFDKIDTRYLNQEALRGMLSFGKGFFDRLTEISVNSELNLSVYSYYRNGKWDVY
jgi:spermidine synthase